MKLFVQFAAAILVIIGFVIAISMPSSGTGTILIIVGVLTAAFAKKLPDG